MGSLLSPHFKRIPCQVPGMSCMSPMAPAEDVIGRLFNIARLLLSTSITRSIHGDGSSKRRDAAVISWLQFAKLARVPAIAAPGTPAPGPPSEMTVSNARREPRRERARRFSAAATAAPCPGCRPGGSARSKLHRSYPPAMSSVTGTCRW